MKKNNISKIFVFSVIAILAVVLLVSNFTKLTGAATKTEETIVYAGLSKEIALGNEFVGEINDNNGYLRTGVGLKVQTSLTASEDDYQTDVVLEVDKDNIRYYLNTNGGIIGRTFNFLGNNFKIIRIGEYNSMIIERDGYLETVKDGSAFIGENYDDPDWVWDLNNLNGNSPGIAIENDFLYNDDSDNPPKVGECINLPNLYARICLDSLNVNDDEYTTYTIEYEPSADLSEVAGDYPMNNIKTIYIHTSSGLIYLGPGAYTRQIWITGNGEVYYNDISNNKIKYLKTVGFSESIGRLNNDLNLAITKKSDNIDINIKSAALEETLTASFSVVKGEIWGLGKTKTYEEANELTWNIQGRETVKIGTKDEDHRTAYGVIIRDPKSHGASDEVVLDIPSKQVKAVVSMSFVNEVPEPPIQKCIDTDGDNIYSKGRITIDGTNSADDYCYTSDSVFEFYCLNDGINIGTSISNCPNGCEDGACMPKSSGGGGGVGGGITYQGVLNMLEQCEVENDVEGMSCAESARSEGGVALNTYLAILYHFPDGRKDVFVATWLESDDKIDKDDVKQWLDLVAGKNAILDSYEVGCYTCYPESSIWRAGKAAVKPKSFFNR